MTDLVSAAREYLSAGLDIIALTGKTPNTMWHPHGLNNAVYGHSENQDDEDLLRQLLAPPTTGIGIVIRHPYLVVDVDGEEGAEALANLLGTYVLDATAVAATARGLHIWYSDVTPRRSTQLGPKLDVKGVGGYVVAPPSLHPSGAVYQWLRPLVVDGSIVPVLELPDALREMFRRHDVITEDARVTMPPGAMRIEFLVRYLRSCNPGARNNVLFWCANRARENGFSQAEALAALVPAAKEVGLQDAESRNAIYSAYRG
jgi:hypothetical protein